MRQFGRDPQFGARMGSLSSPVDITDFMGRVHLRNWKEEEELDFSFCSDDPSAERRLVIGKNACRHSGLKIIGLPSKTAI
jgi:hypothetical protein